MVLYEFECEQCGRVEKRCRLSTVETACPRCGKIIRRAFSFDVNIHVVPSYHEALEETTRLAEEGKI